MTVKALALTLKESDWRLINWREGSGAPLTSRFARLRARPAHEDFRRNEPRPEEWLVIEWPEDEDEPTKYWFSTLDAGLSFEKLVDIIKLRWRIERDYQDLKQELGLGHYEGRGWRGFHHHATLCIAAYATFEKRLALVIGNSAYENASRLDNPVRDAKAVAVALRSMGFEVIRRASTLR